MNSRSSAGEPSITWMAFVLTSLVLVASTLIVTSKLPLFPSSLAGLVSVAKDIALAGVVGTGLIVLARSWRIKLSSGMISYILLCGLVMVHVAISPIGMVSIKAALPILLPPLLFYTLRQIEAPADAAISFLRILVWGIFGVSLIGLVGHIMFYEKLNQAMQIWEYLDLSGSGVGNVIRYSKDGKRTSRMLGVSINPTETAVLAAFMMLYAFAIIRGKFARGLILAIGLSTAWFTYTRSIFMGCALSGIVLLVERMSLVNRTLVRFGGGISVIVAIMGLYTAQDAILGELDGSAQIHMKDLISGPELVISHWYGAGLGMTTLMARQAGIDVPEVHLESDHLMIAYQLGIVGYLLFVFTYIAPVISIVKVMRRRAVDHVPFVSVGFFLGVFFAGVIFPLILTSRASGYLQWLALWVSWATIKRANILPCKCRENLA